MSALEQVLAAVQQRMLRERRAIYARHAAWGSVIVALLAVVVHLWVRPVGTRGMLAAVAVPWLLAALQAVATRPGRAQCAQWADLHLGGRSGFATLQELSAAQAAGPAAAVKHLEAWLDGVSRSALARLQEMPLATSLAKPLAAALVCASLAVALLQLPAQHLASSRAAPAGPSMAAADRPDSTARPGPRPPDVASATRAPRDDDARSGAEPASSNGLQATAATPQQQAASRDDTLPSGEPPPGTRTAARPSATGREAGDSTDTGGDGALVEPWQGDLAARLREIAATQTPPAARAAPIETAEYAAAVAHAGASSGGDLPQVAAAEPPPAAASLTLGPAEQAYVRAYGADTGARP